MGYNTAEAPVCSEGKGLTVRDAVCETNGVLNKINELLTVLEKTVAMPEIEGPKKIDAEPCLSGAAQYGFYAANEALSRIERIMKEIGV